MSIKIYNTLTRKKEDFQPLIDGKVRMYVCGPTVYTNAHVGHAMSALVFDIIRRYFDYRGYQVKLVMNFTDVDDKIIHRANEQGADPFKLAEGYIQEYAQNMIDLNVLPAIGQPARHAGDGADHRDDLRIDREGLCLPGGRGCVFPRGA